MKADYLKMLSLAMGISASVMMVNVFYSIGIERKEVRIVLENQAFNIFEMVLAVISVVGLVLVMKEKLDDIKWKNANIRN